MEIGSGTATEMQSRLVNMETSTIKISTMEVTMMPSITEVPEESSGDLAVDDVTGRARGTDGLVRGTGKLDTVITPVPTSGQTHSSNVLAKGAEHIMGDIPSIEPPVKVLVGQTVETRLDRGLEKQQQELVKTRGLPNMKVTQSTTDIPMVTTKETRLTTSSPPPRRQSYFNRPRKFVVHRRRKGNRACKAHRLRHDTARHMGQAQGIRH